MLDEMTAALPANLTERVLEVIGAQRGGDRSVIFISHRMIEIGAVATARPCCAKAKPSASSTSTLAPRSVSSS